MVKFDLVPDLQIQRVTFDGAEIPFVQESRGHDGSFYLQMPARRSSCGRTYDVTFDYSGSEIHRRRIFRVACRCAVSGTQYRPETKAAQLTI